MKAELENGLNWVENLPAVLAEIRMTPHPKTKLSPFEVIMGRPFPTPWVHNTLIRHKTTVRGPCLTGDMDTVVSDYTHALIKKLFSIHGNVSSVLPIPATKPSHPYRPGDLL